MAITWRFLGKLLKELKEEGKNYAINELPERVLLNILKKNNIKEIAVEELLEKSNLDKKVFFIGLSNMKKNRWIAQSKATGEDKMFPIAEDYPKTKLEEFMEKIINNKNNLGFSTLSKDEKVQYHILNKRKLINKARKTKRVLYLTDKGKKIDVSKIEKLKQVSRITSEMLSSGTWKDYNIKPFDVTKPGPLLKAGKIHPMINLINQIREIFISLGFTEIRGPIIESAFFNFDALFQPQDHPARELHDTFYLNNLLVSQ